MCAWPPNGSAQGTHGLAGVLLQCRKNYLRRVAVTGQGRRGRG